MSQKELYKLEEFLAEYKGMSLAPCKRNELSLKGKFSFTAAFEDSESLVDSYELNLLFNSKYPKSIPKVIEIGWIIPKIGDFHVNGDGSLCLGSPISIMKIIKKDPSLIGFVDSCLVPYLMQVSLKRRNGGKFILGELKHGEEGIVAEYGKIFSLSTEDQVRKAIKLLGQKKRIANKKKCPCGCGKRLGVCSLHSKLNEYRKVASRSWFNVHSQNLGQGM